MLKKIIEYTNFNDEKKTREVYFHLSKAEMTRLAADPTLMNKMHDAAKQSDKKAMLESIEEFIRLAYGVRSEDGERFLKSEMLADEFVNSAAYDELLMEIVLTPEAFNKFVEAILPADLLAKAIEEAKKTGQPDPFAEPPNPESDKGTPAQEVSDITTPAWIREKRRPTKAEIRAMPRDAMILAIQSHPSLKGTEVNIPAIAKKVVYVAIQIGVGKIVHDIIEKNVEAEKPHHKVAVPVAAYAIGGVVAEASSDYTDRMIDELVEAIDKIKNRNQSNPELKLIK